MLIGYLSIDRESIERSGDKSYLEQVYNHRSFAQYYEFTE